MKKKKRLLIALSVLVLALASLPFILRQDAVFDGDRVSSADPARFYLRFRVMNTVDSEIMSLREGDELHLSWQIESGSVDLQIARGDEAPIYQANGRGKGDRADFELTIPASGDYAVTVSGRQAKGWIEVEQALRE